jgi:hypothetical protein
MSTLPTLLKSLTAYVLGEKHNQHLDSGSDSENDHHRNDDHREHDDGSHTDTESERGEASSEQSTVSGSQEEIISPETTRLEETSDKWNNPYMSVVPKQLWNKELKRLVEAYNLFKYWFKSQVPHYLMHESEYAVTDLSVEGRALFINENQRGIRCTTAPHTYLVRRDLHYLYSYLITRALVGVNESEACRAMRRRWMQRQTKAMHFCDMDTHRVIQCDGRLCRNCTVLYTRRSGALYQHAIKLCESNTQLAPDESLCGRVQPIAFHLANYMCGPLPDREGMEKLVLTATPYDTFPVDQRESTDWIALHPIYLDLWTASNFSADSDHM